VAEHDSVIPAGGSGRLTATVKTVEGQNRRISKSITVVTDVSGARPLVLRFTVEVYSPIVVRPSYRLYLTTLEGDAGRTRVVLHRIDGEALKISEVVAEHPELLVRTLPVTSESGPSSDDAGTKDLWEEMAARRRPIDAAPGDVWIELSTPATLAPGNINGALRLKTNDPEAPELSLPYMVRVRPMIEVRPAAVRMWLSPEGGMHGRSAIVALRHNQGKEFAITGVTTSHPDIFKAAANSAGSAARQIIRVSLIDGLEEETLSGTVEGWIEVTTDNPNRSLVEIPVIVASNRALSRRPVATRPAPTR
jgi:hypothetical protein